MNIYPKSKRIQNDSSDPRRNQPDGPRFQSNPKSYTNKPNRPRHFVSDQNISEEYHQSKRGGKRPQHRRSRGTQRINQLKDMVDNIISDCKIESKQVKAGLQQIKDYQLQVLQELQQDYDDSPRRYDRDFQRGGLTVDPREFQPQESNQSKIAQEVIQLRQQKLGLMKQLNDQIRRNNELTRQCKKLQNINARLRKDLEKRQQPQGRYANSNNNRLDQTQYQNQSIINKLNNNERGNPNKQLQRDNAKLRNQLARLQDQLRRNYNQDDQQSIQAIKKQNSQLRQDLNYAEEQIRKLNKKLSSGNPYGSSDRDQIRRLNQIIAKQQQKIAQLQDRLRANGDLQRQFQKLRDQNEELRVQTIKLLKKKDNRGGNSNNNEDVQMLQDEIMRLHDDIEKQNISKKRFLEQVASYKKQFTVLQSQNKNLKRKNQELQDELRKNKGAIGSSNNLYQPYSYGGSYGSSHQIPQYKTFNTDYDVDLIKKYETLGRQPKPQPTSTYDQMANVLLDEGSKIDNGFSKLDKYKNVLSDLRNVRNPGA